MIFRRKPTPEPASPVSPDDDAFETADDDVTDDDALDDVDEADEEQDNDEDEADDDEAAADDEPDPWTALDLSQDWRDDGPFDIDEVDLDEDTVARLDLGTLIVTPAEGLQLQIIADPETGQGMALVAMSATSAIQVTLFAAPSSLGFATDVRDDMIAETTQAGGTSELAEGPFGTELRRVVPATDDAGNSGMAPLRDWFAQGPRWLLNARLMGQAALDSTGAGELAVFDDFFRNLVVRRGDGAMVPGQVIGLTLPTSGS